MGRGVARDGVLLFWKKAITKFLGGLGICYDIG